MQATSTTLLLLEQKVNLLQSQLNWSITITVGITTVLIGLFLAVQFISARQYVKEKLKSIDRKTAAAKKELREEINNLSSKIDRESVSTTAHNARTMAYACLVDKSYDGAIFWKLFEATYYYFGRLHNYEDHVAEILDSVISILKTNSKDGKLTIEIDKDSFEQIPGMLEVLKSEWPIKITEIEKLLSLD